ncbi:MAG: hypothetical protein ACXWRA_14570, partial [Pseudobdellovibrionaceae bacterium]
RYGYSQRYRWDRGYSHPRWWSSCHRFPLFTWLIGITSGYWQCTAFDYRLRPYSSIGYTMHEAAYNAMYKCGRRRARELCYIPSNYCNYYYP